MIVVACGIDDKGERIMSLLARHNIPSPKLMSAGGFHDQSSV
jgi:hypothetical protein